MVFALPVSPVLTKGVFQRAVRIDDRAKCGPVLQLQYQLDLLVGAVLFQKFLEGGADGGFVPGTSLLEDFLNLVVVFLNEVIAKLNKRCHPRPRFREGKLQRGSRSP
jgi:hypothetical protein